MNPNLLSQMFPTSFLLSHPRRNFFHGIAKEVGKKCERSFPLYINILSILYTFFHIFHNNNNNKKGKYAKNKGMVNIPLGVYGEPCERRERREWRPAERGLHAPAPAVSRSFAPAELVPPCPPTGGFAFPRRDSHGRRVQDNLVYYQYLNRHSSPPMPMVVSTLILLLIPGLLRWGV
jgi:hypothetical protein